MRTPPEQAEWSHLTHEQLYAQIRTGPGGAAALAAQDLWSGAGEVLESGHARITSALDASAEGWTGTAADATRGGLAPLTAWALAAVDDAHATVSAVVAQGDHADRLRTLMPPPNTADVQAAQAAVAAAPPRFGPGLQANRLASAQAEAQNLSDDAFRLMNDYADGSDHRVVDLDRWSVPPAVTVDAAPIGAASAGSAVPTSPGSGSSIPTGGGGRSVSVGAGGGDAGGPLPAGAAALLPGYGGRGGPATSGRGTPGTVGAAAAARSSGAGSLPVGGAGAATRPGSGQLGVGGPGGTGVPDPRLSDRAATPRPGVISSDTPGGTGWGTRGTGTLPGDETSTAARRPTTGGYGGQPTRGPGVIGSGGESGQVARGPGTSGYGGEGGPSRWSGGAGSSDEAGPVARGPGTSGYGGEAGPTTRGPGTSGYGGEGGFTTRGPGASGISGEAGPTSRWPGASGSWGGEPGSSTRWSTGPGPGGTSSSGAERGLGTSAGEPAAAGRGSTGNGIYPPMVGGGGRGQDGTHRRPDWLVDDSGAFEDHRWFPPAVLGPDDPLPPASLG